MDSTKLLSLLFVGGTAIVGSIIYKYFSKADLITMLKAEYQNNKNCLSKDLALQIMLLGIKNGNNLFATNHSSIDTNRRSNINNKDVYDEICQETLNQRQECYDDEFLKIIKQFEGKFSMNELIEISGGLPPMQLAHILYRYDVPYYEGKIPSVQTSVEIFKLYVDFILKGLKESKINIDDNDIFAKKELYFKFYYLNLKINDIIYEKYNHTNIDIVKYVLRTNHKFDDKEIKQLQNSIKNFDDILLSY